MKKTITVLVIGLMLLASCATIEFQEAMPQGTAELKTFPEDIVGTYVHNDSNDSITLIFNHKNFKYTDSINTMFSLEGSLSDKRFVLKKFGDFFMMNIKNEKDDNWTVLPFKLDNGNISVFHMILYSKTDSNDATVDEHYKKDVLKRLSAITDIKTINNSDKSDVYLINPTDQETKAMLEKGLFTELHKLKRVK